MKTNEESIAIISITLAFLVGTGLIFGNQKWELYPTFLLSCITAIFSFIAYKHSKEKFRLELFEKRYLIYENVVKFCSSVTQNATLKRIESESEEIAQSKISGRIAAHEAFRGLGYHKSEMLFGPDIKILMEQLNKSFSTLVIQGYPPSHKDYEEWRKKEEQALDVVLNTIEELPKLFKSYMYFGDYKNTDLERTK